MPAVTGLQIVQGCFGILNVYLPNETPSNTDGEYARAALNDILSEWRQRKLFSPFVERRRFDLVVNQGEETDPYTIGDGGDFNVAKPANQNAIEAANLILTATSPETRVPLGIFTTTAYDANQIPSLSNNQPTGLFYNPTYDDDLGAIFLWPVPDTAVNDLELFLWNTVGQFADLTTEYFVPDGWPRALKYTLADALQGSYGKNMSPSDQRIAMSSVATIKRANVQLFDLMNDASWSADRRTVYNILTGSGG